MFRILSRSAIPIFFRLYTTGQEKTDELEKEIALRERVLQSYPGLRAPSISNFTYSSFSNSENDVISSSKIIPHSNGRQRIFLLLFTGFMIVWTYRTINNKMQKENLMVPIWTASSENQAKHFLFLIQYSKGTRDALVSQFSILKEGNPLIDFFEWIAVQKPDFGVGYKYNAQVVLNVICSAFNSSNNLVSFRLLAPEVWKTRGEENSRQTIDALVDAIVLSKGIQNTFATSISPLNFSVSSSLPPNVAQSSLSDKVQETQSHSTTPQF